ncbi:MAG TPA: rRNA maturation RNase YbeY [Chlamydiales bacterium]|nr:rRNA maturation RNase YbeY [Chlamydiales bacterium]
MDIEIHNRQKDLRLSKLRTKRLVQSVLSFLGTPANQVALYFVTEKKICQLHQQFFNDPSPTDCISCPLDAEHLGEVFICPSIAIQYAKKRHLDPYAETELYIVHGLLHLLGFDDLEEKERRTMRKKEKSCMRHLRLHKLSICPK